MAVKSIVDIEVNDGAFQKFHDTFQKYQAALAKTPKAWQDANKNIDGGLKSFEALVAAEVASLGHQKLIVQAQEKAARLTRTTADKWREIGRHTKGIATDIKDMTTNLLKWAGLTSVFSGIIGAGGLFGITRMSEGVAAGRRGSMGIGTSIGEQNAFRNSFDRLVDSNSFLGNINDALHSATGKASLFGVGLNRPGDLSGSTSDVGLRYLERARALAKSSNPEFDVQTMHARGMDKYMSLQDFQRLRATSDTEFNDLRTRYGRNVGAMGVSSRDQLAYQNFTTTLDEAGNRLNAVFVRGIAPLIPSLEKLSNATTDAVKSFLEAPALKKWINDAGDGLKWFAGYVGSDDFQKKVKDIATGLGEMASELSSFVKWIASLHPKKTIDEYADDKKNEHPLDSWALKAMGFGSDKPAGETGAPSHGGLVANSKMMWQGRALAGASAAPAGLRAKADAGYIDPGLGALAKEIQDNTPGINRFTAFNDDYHSRRKSAHNQNRAFDVTVDDPAQAEAVADRIRAELRARGEKLATRGNMVDGVINEYAHPSKGATGGHLHVELERTPTVRIDNAAGSNFIVSTSQMSAGTVPQ